jgi:hypothetical protein
MKGRKRCTVWSEKAEIRISKQEWNSIDKVLKRAEYALDRYMVTDIIQHISCARSRVKFKTIEPSPLSTHKKLARYYNGLGFGINVYLRSHIDRDFTLSIVQAHINNHDYQVDDRILCYSTFPRIGTAVALWHGYFLIFNPQEPHSIFSPCKSGDKMFCISSYLNSLSAMDGRDRPLLNKLCSTVVSCQIFIRSQSLIVR